MQRSDVLVIGAGLSGLAFAWQAAKAGRRVTVLERERRIGGCFHSHRRPDGYWYEMGAHTTYNSYAGSLELAADVGATAKLVQRGPQRAHFGLLRAGRYRWLTPPRILLQLNWLEAALRAPFGVFAGKAGRSMRGYFEALLGKGNYQRVFKPFFAAVPCQSADDFPAEGAGSLFKTRPRNEAYPRSYGFEGGLQTVLDGIAAMPGVTIETGVVVASLARDGADWVATAADGRTWRAGIATLATTVDETARLARPALPALADIAARIGSVRVDSVGVVLPRARCWMPEIAFLVPVDDMFHSAVTRDPFPDPARRAFVFHFKPGLSREARMARMAEVLRVAPAEFDEIVEQKLVLPSPALGHGALVAEVDQILAGGTLAAVGNWFDGLGIEDCVQRARAEWRRVAPLALGAAATATGQLAPALA